MNNIQSSVQSFKPQQNNSNQLEVYDSSQEYPLSGQNNSSGNNSGTESGNEESSGTIEKTEG